MLYDYVCSECQHIWEVSSPMAESSIKRECPLCGHGGCERYYGTAPAFGNSDGLAPKRVSEGFKDVMRNIRDKAIGGKEMKSSII